MGITSITYSFPYLAFLIYLSALLFLEFRLLRYGKDIKSIRWATILGFVFFFGLRGFVFSDWYMYYNLFEKMPTLWDGGLTNLINGDFEEVFATDVSTGKTGVEMGFVYSTFIFKSIINNYFAWVCISVLVDMILLDIFIRRYSPYYVLSVLLFIAFGGLIIECNLMRNVKAIMLFLISLKYLEERKIVPYMLLNFVGFLFHSSAMVFFPLYFFLHKKIPTWLLWAIFLLGNTITLLHISYLQPLMLSFADMVGGRLGVQIKLYFAIDFFNQSYGISIGYLERVITYLLIILFQNKLIQQNERNRLFINGYVLYFFIFFFFSEIMVAVERLSLLFVFSYWILYPNLLALVKEIANKVVFTITLILFCYMKVVMATINVFAKYDNVLFGIESYESRIQRVENDMDTLMDSK